MNQEIEQVEEALIDVKEMIKANNTTTSDWMLEWTQTVQQILITNSGWGWEGFWEMIEYNLYHPACPVSVVCNVPLPASRAQISHFAGRTSTKPRVFERAA